ncbi:baseplate assembly protein [Gluconobacter morbifer]|uniref:Phage-related baseplate assembly protein n=1 Tax=Gluconobacter morbifer G707 TaxID=1088869 RepID=G6XMB8_9PROT|nr:baseplate assembly protein [Gluconobacter morbifer]EHH67016.1 phage-related baseplate assembly protein [Gluconobacter morbifer G707]
MSDARFDAVSLLNRTAHTVFGIVSAVDPVNHAVRVRLQPDDVETGWLPDMGGVQAGDLRLSCPSAPGTHVVLQPLEGDGEHLVVTGAVYDTVVTAPVSPWTGRVAQPGEMLVRAGCGAPPVTPGQLPGGPSGNGDWWHVGPDDVAVGAGNARMVIQNDEIRLSVGGGALVLGPSGLTVTGGDVRTDQHSLNDHVPVLGTEKTEGPTG